MEVIGVKQIEKIRVKVRTENGRFFMHPDFYQRVITFEKNNFPIKKKAESEGFEPSDPQCRSTVFETAPFDRSGNSPLGRKNS